MNKHILDKPILRNLFWFIVLPYDFKQWLKEYDKAHGRELEPSGTDVIS